MTNSTLNIKDIEKALRENEIQKFEDSLPISRKSFDHLFDYLDKQLGEEICANTLIVTKTFLVEHEIPNIDQVVSWLNN
ncbi:hypothetical protein [Sphingobacterium sp. MYb382]|uniref:hypothetical protein n=1 Tax=Sphingobacterium sp. MYb382 TaxID=2745278 RepID=UPI00309FAF9C